MSYKLNKQIAECIGLWLAEVDRKTENEITFTNNCWNLISFFHLTLNRIYNFKKYNVRIYVYSKRRAIIDLPINNVKLRFYEDKRARKPYFIWRVCSKELITDWKSKVRQFSKGSLYHKEMLRGFFAGEGSVKSSSHNSRSLTMSQSKPIKIIDRSLNYSGISYKFDTDHRKGYCIQGRKNWDKLSSIKIAELHPEKRNRFYGVYSEFKQYHYPRGHLKNIIKKELFTPKTASELSKIVKRSQARVCDVLIELKKQGTISNFRVHSKDYWIKKNQGKIIVSDTKIKYLDLLSCGSNSKKIRGK